MVKYVKEKDVIATIKSWWACAMMADGRPTLCDEIRALPGIEQTTPAELDFIKELEETRDKMRRLFRNHDENLACRWYDAGVGEALSLINELIEEHEEGGQ